MKKAAVVLILLLNWCLCSAQDANYIIEKYEALDRQEQYSSIISEIRGADESTYSASEYYYLGLAYFRLEDDAEAQRHLKIAVQKAPDFTAAYYYLAGSCFYTENYDEAISYYEKCIELDNAYSKAYRMLGAIYESTGDLDKALANYSRFHELEKSPEASYWMAYILYKMKEYQKAKPYAEEYLKHDENSFSMNNLMVLILYSEGKYRKAAKYEERLKEVWRNSNDESIRKQSFFIIHSFAYKGFSVDVYEKFDQSGDFYCPLICDVTANGKIIKTINLEYDAVTAEFGCPYFLGVDETETKIHRTSEIGFKKYPKFDDFIKCVKLILDDKVQFGASSSPN